MRPARVKLHMRESFCSVSPPPPPPRPPQTDHLEFHLHFVHILNFIYTLCTFWISSTLWARTTPHLRNSHRINWDDDQGNIECAPPIHTFSVQYQNSISYQRTLGKINIAINCISHILYGTSLQWARAVHIVHCCTVAVTLCTVALLQYIVYFCTVAVTFCTFALLRW